MISHLSTGSTIVLNDPNSILWPKVATSSSEGHFSLRKNHTRKLQERHMGDTYS